MPIQTRKSYCTSKKATTPSTSFLADASRCCASITCNLQQSDNLNNSVTQARSTTLSTVVQ